MNKIKVSTIIAFAILTTFVSECRGDAADEIVTDLGNGCTVTRKIENTTSSSLTFWWLGSLPRMNCSNSELTRFEAKGVVVDIKSLVLSYNNMIEFYIDDLVDMTSLTRIEFKGNRLQRIVESTKNLTLKNITFISLTHNKLTAIPNEALKSFPNLTALTIISNEIEEIKHDDFRFNAKLQYIQVGPNPIKKFNASWMAKLPKLVALGLKDCGLNEVPKELASIKDLSYIDLSRNNFTRLPANSFDKCTSLRHISLASSNITVIESNVFPVNHELASIDLSDNYIETLPPNTFDGMGKDNIDIDLYENPLNCNCSLAWFKRWSNEVEENDISAEIRYKCVQPLRNHNKKSGQITLEDFTCNDDDQIWIDCQATVPPLQRPIMQQTTTKPATTTTPTDTNIGDKSLCPLKCTCYDENGKVYSEPKHPITASSSGFRWYGRSYPRVVCHKADLTMIPVDKIRSDVAMIALSDNKIKSVDWSMLKKFKKLKIIDFKKNSIDTIVEASSDLDLPSVTSINLRFNNIQTLTKGHLRCFKNLEVLGFYHNRITEIPQDLFGFNSKLNRLFMGSNPIKNFKEDFMKTLNLKSLSLRNMSLTEIPKTLKNLENLTYCDLSDNFITVVKNMSFIKCQNLYRLGLENNNVSTIESYAFKNATSLRHLMLSENNISTLPANVFSFISQERLDIELWENPFVCDCKLKPFKTWIDTMQRIDPTTDIRFRCTQPLRNHNLYSDKMTQDQFSCETNDITYLSPQATKCEPSNPSGAIALAVILTFIITVLCGVVAWRIAFRQKYGYLLKYANQRDDYADMEELQ